MDEMKREMNPPDDVAGEVDIGLWDMLKVMPTTPSNIDVGRVAILPNLLSTAFFGLHSKSGTADVAFRVHR
jgi:hypothetical protein